MHLCAGVRYKEFNFRKRAFDILSCVQNLQNSTTKDSRQYAHAWDYCTLTKGHDIPHGVGYCLLFVVGIAEPLMDNIQ